MHSPSTYQAQGLFLDTDSLPWFDFTYLNYLENFKHVQLNLLFGAHLLVGIQGPKWRHLCLLLFIQLQLQPGHYKISSKPSVIADSLGCFSESHFSIPVKFSSCQRAAGVQNIMKELISDWSLMTKLRTSWDTYTLLRVLLFPFGGLVWGLHLHMRPP